MRVVSFGLGLGLRGERYRHVDVVPLFELTRAAAAFDVGIAPLADIAMNRARSNIKLKEYAAAGACLARLADRPLRGIGEKQGGRLVADDGWHEALAAPGRQAARAREAHQARRKWVAGETLTKHAATWEAQLRAGVARARAAAAAA